LEGWLAYPHVGIEIWCGFRKTTRSGRFTACRRRSSGFLRLVIDVKVAMGICKYGIFKKMLSVELGR
jgi:hypothetical protein